MNYLMNAELAASSVSAYCWETMAISKHMVWNDSYRYRYTVWIEVLALLAYARPLVRKL